MTNILAGYYTFRELFGPEITAKEHHDAAIVLIAMITIPIALMYIDDFIKYIKKRNK